MKSETRVLTMVVVCLACAAAWTATAGETDAAGKAALADPAAQVQELVRVAKDPQADPKERQKAIQGLQQLRGKAATAIPDLLELMKPGDRNYNSYVRAPAREALAAIGAPAVEPLLKVLADPERSEDAEQALGRIGKEAIAGLTTALKDGNSLVRKGAAGALARAGKAAAPAVPALASLLKDPEGEVVAAAIAALGKVGPDAAAAVPALVEALKTGSAQHRVAIADTLGMIGPAASAAIPALVERLADTKEAAATRAAIATALGKLGPDSVAPLVTMLKSENEEVRWNVALALANLGEAAVPGLVAALADTNAMVRRYAAFALAKIGPKAKDAVPALVEAIKDKEPTVRRNAADALGRIGPAAKDAVPALIRALEDKEHSVKLAAVNALGLLGEEAASACPTLVRLLEKASASDLRWTTAEALGRCGVGNTAVVAPLIAALKDENPNVRWAAAQALVRVGEPAIAALREAAKDEATKHWANYALEQMKPKEAPKK